MEDETLEAKLRNQLTPLYGLAELILLLDEKPELKPELKPLIIDIAKQAVSNKNRIDFLLDAIESKTENKPDVMRRVFIAGQENIIDKTKYALMEQDDFDNWILNNINK